MYDFGIMQIDERIEQLQHIQLYFRLTKLFPTLEQIVEGVVGAQLQQYVDVLVVFEGMLELYDVGVPQRLMDLDFADELNNFLWYFLLGAWLGEVALLDDLDSVELLAVLLAKFVAASEPPLAKEVPLNILGGAVGQQALIFNHEQVLVGCVRWRCLRSGRLLIPTLYLILN